MRIIVIACLLMAVSLSTYADDRVQHQPVEHRIANEQSSRSSKDRGTAIFAAIAIGVGVAIVLTRDTNGEPQTTIAPDPATKTPTLTYQARFK